MTMICLSGGPALSRFRQSQRFEQLRALHPDLKTMSAHYVYFIDQGAVQQGLTEASPRLLSMLSASGPFQAEPDGITLHVVPRLGTRTAWSTKASDIARRCAMEGIERIERGISYHFAGLNEAPSDAQLVAVADILRDRMTEALLPWPYDPHILFQTGEPAPLVIIDIHAEGREALVAHNDAMGLALSDDELSYLYDNFLRLQRNPSDAELMMFAQANSEHCRHKIFNASWTLDGQPSNSSLFSMIRNTHECSPGGVLSAYHDNAAVIEGGAAWRWMPDAQGQYQASYEPVHIQIKVETHNHPTAISPFPGAATGSGGEIRDEGAVGNGSKPKAGLCGFSVSDLAIPGFTHDWEVHTHKPDRIASALQIMLEGPIGAAAFNNEFGRPNLCGYFRTFCQRVQRSDGVKEVRGYHKPIMIAGGLGNIRVGNIDKLPVPPGSALVVLGGPSMLIGLGGGAASSVASGQTDSDLDYASVQRGNPEMQRRCQEVIDRCVALGETSPILSMHDVGAGGLSNALPELISDAQRGGRFDLRAVPSDEPSMSPMAIWSNESQERYVMAIDAQRLADFEAICARERCPYAVVGETTSEPDLVVNDPLFDNQPVNMPLDVLLGKPPGLSIAAQRMAGVHDDFTTEGISIEDAVQRVLRLPAVAAKNFLITIGDRSITGQVARDQLVGPWQMPVADVAVTVSDYQGYAGEAMAMGERAPLALSSAARSARIAVAEALTNIMAADIGDLSQVKLSANWMAACGHPGEDAALFDAVKAVGLELAPALGIAIPVGKDSLSMKTLWHDKAEQHSVTAPLSLIVSAFAPVQDVRNTLTPQLRTDCGNTHLLLVDLGAGQNRMAGSALAQVYQKMGQDGPDVDQPEWLSGLFNALQALIRQQLVLAWHDRSDGGLFVTLAEMAFAGHTGLSVNLQGLPGDPLSILFNEEVGGVLQICDEDFAKVLAVFERFGLRSQVHLIGSLCQSGDMQIRKDQQLLYRESVNELKRQWWQTSYRMQRQRDNPECADQEFEHISHFDDPGLSPHLTFNPDDLLVAHSPSLIKTRPKVAILREQGVNGHFEMAAAFHAAGFDAVDVHMSDLLEGRHHLDQFKVLAACGGFSFGDVLGAGGGWAGSILFNAQLSDMFQHFFERSDTLALGVCNGCQMLSRLHSLIPGAEHWPRFVSNRSSQFEARVATVEVQQSPSVLFSDMQGSRLPVAIAHGEGRAEFSEPEHAQQARVVLGYVDNYGQKTERYPLNPNGSIYGITGLCNASGRVTIMMPHPERVWRTVTHSWAPSEWGEYSPWFRLFENARVWVD